MILSLGFILTLGELEGLAVGKGEGAGDGGFEGKGEGAGDGAAVGHESHAVGHSYQTKLPDHVSSHQ